MTAVKSAAQFAFNKKLLSTAILTAALSACGGGGGGGDAGPSGPSFELAYEEVGGITEETALPNSDIATVSATDASANRVYRFEVVGSSDFEVTSESKLRYIGPVNNSFDYEASSTVSIQLRGTPTITTAGTNGEPDTVADGAPITRSVSVDIIDVNEAPTSITLSKNTVIIDEQGAEVGNLDAVDPDTNAAFTDNIFTIQNSEDSLFEIPAGTSTLKLKSTASLGEGGEAIALVNVKGVGSEASFNASLTVEAVEATPVGPLMERTASDYYPVFPNLVMAATSESPDPEQDPVPVNLTFASLDSATDAYPLTVSIDVPVFEDANSANPGPNTETASVDEFMVSEPSSAGAAIGQLILKKYIVEAPAGIAKLGTNLNPKMTIGIDLIEDLPVFSQALISETANGIAKSLATKEVEVSIKIPFLPSQKDTLNYTGSLYIEKLAGNDSLLPLVIDPNQSIRNTYVVNLIINIQMSASLISAANLAGIDLPESVRLTSVMTLAEGLGFTSRTLTVEDTGANLSISGSFVRGAVSSAQNGPDGDGDLWLNSVDQYPSEADFH